LIVTFNKYRPATILCLSCRTLVPGGDYFWSKMLHLQVFRSYYFKNIDWTLTFGFTSYCSC